VYQADGRWRAEAKTPRFGTYRHTAKRSYKPPLAAGYRPNCRRFTMDRGLSYTDGNLIECLRNLMRVAKVQRPDWFYWHNAVMLRHSSRLSRSNWRSSPA